MIERLRSLLRPDIDTLNTIEIDGTKLLHNLSYLQSLQQGDAIFPVLKSNAYAHGLEEVSKLLRHTNVPYICVDSFPEYQIVKKRSRHKVLVMGETIPENYRHYDTNRATFAVYNLPTVRYLATSNKRCKVHLFLNTGMNREGIQHNELDDILDLLQQAKHIELEGVMSHLANADETDSSRNHNQVQTFKVMSQKVKAAGFTPQRYHIGNSAGIAKLDDPLLNARRSGIAFYGYNHLQPDDDTYEKLAPLKPAFRVVSRVVSLQQLHQGAIVSYGGTYTAQQSEQVATLPFGYYEGLPRAVSNNRTVRRNEQQLPLIGRVCMNLCSIATKGHQLALGDTVELISDQPNAPNSITQLAKKSDTIPYEALIRFTQKTRRVLHSDSNIL